MPRRKAVHLRSLGAAPFRSLAVLSILCVAGLLAVGWEAPLAQGPPRGLELARKLMANQRLDRAMREVVKVLQEDPENLEGWKLKGEISLRQTDLDGALESWTEASRLAPEDTILLTSLGDLLIRRNDRLDDALAAYDRVLRLNPSDTRVLVSKGSIYERREQWEEAARAYRAALDIDPNLVRARSSVGAVFFKVGRFDDASRELRKAIELSPRDLRSHVFLGLAQNHLGHFDLALEELKEAILIDPHFANQLIGVREQQAQFKHLNEVFQKAYEASPLEAGRSYDLAVIQFYAQDYEAAWRHLVRAEHLKFPIPLELKEVVYSRRKLRTP